MRSPIDQKVCPACRRTLPYSDYYEKKLKGGKRTLSGYCRDCTRLKSREWVEKNYERAKSRWANDARKIPRALMSDDQRERVRLSANKYVATHRDQVNEKNRICRTKSKSADPETFRAKTAIYNNRTRARRKGVPTDFTVVDWAEVLIRFDQRCAWCGTAATRLDLDHVQPLHLGGHDTVGNIVPVCRPCNAEKSSSAPATFARTMGADLSEILRKAAIRPPVTDVLQILDGFDQ